MVELYEVLPQPLTPGGLLLGSGANTTLSSFRPTPLEVIPATKSSAKNKIRCYQRHGRVSVCPP